MRKGIQLYYQVGGLRGLAVGVLGTALGFQKTMRVRLPGTPNHVWLRVPSTDVATFREVLSNEEYRLNTKQAPKTIVDAGANVGLASVYFAMQFPEARIIAIEPESENFALLQRNVAGFPNVTPIRAALWNVDGQISLLDPGLGPSGYVTGQNGDASSELHQQRETVQAVSMDSLIAEYGLERVDILKVDIEGAELEVFDDAGTWIDKVDTVVIELHDRFKVGCEKSFLTATEDFGPAWSIGENTFRTRSSGCIEAPAGH